MRCCSARCRIQPRAAATSVTAERKEKRLKRSKRLRQGFERIEAVNDFLKEEGYPLNSSGGEIKGNPEQLLEQSSTLADRVEVSFADGVQIIPGCYYEFALRYPDKEGRIFSGFIAGSADKIFESTDFR